MRTHSKHTMYHKIVNSQLSQIQQELNLNRTQTLQYLIDFYSFKKIRELIIRLKILEAEGMSAELRASLSVLYSYLESLSERLL